MKQSVREIQEKISRMKYERALHQQIAGGLELMTRETGLLSMQVAVREVDTKPLKLSNPETFLQYTEGSLYL